jgi:hypothetical protein
MCGACVDGTALREHGGDRGNQHTGGCQDDYNNLGKQGNSSSYWAARLKRDAPEYHVAEQVETIISRRKRAQKKAGEYDGPEEAEDALPQNGENQHTLEGGSSNQKTLNHGGGDTDHLTARIACDHEEVREKRLRTGNPFFAGVIRV